jgi:hypothetical protein
MTNKKKKRSTNYYKSLKETKKELKSEKETTNNNDRKLKSKAFHYSCSSLTLFTVFNLVLDLQLVHIDAI